MRALAWFFALASASAADAQTATASGWRVGTEAAVAGAHDFAYLGVATSIERRGPRDVWLGGRVAALGGPLADVDCFSPPCSRVVEGWGSGEGTAAAEAVSGGMVLRAVVGLGGAYLIDDGDDRLVPQASAGLGVDLYPVRFVGFGVRVDGVARAIAPGVQVSTGLRIRLGA